MENYLEEEQPKDQDLQKPHEQYLHAPTLEKYPFLKWLFPLLIALFIMLLGGIYLLDAQKPDQPVKKQTQTHQASTSLQTNILDQITKTYPQNIVWQNVKRGKITYREYDKDYNMHEITLPAYQITGSGTLDVTKECFSKCEYETVTKQFGWKTDNNTSADGPTGSLWGYIREVNEKKQVIMLDYTNKTFMTNKNIPMETKCPCNVEYTFSLSDPF